MFPLVPDGTLLLVQPGAPYRVGDILLVRLDDERWAAHRLIRLDGERVVLRGDNNPFEDAPVEKGHVVGPVVLMLRKGQELRPESAWVRLMSLGVVRFMRAYRGLRRLQMRTRFRAA